MKFTWKWLEEFISIEATPADVAERLTMAGLEVDAIESVGADLGAVVCAEVLSVQPHPAAERLRVCEVTTGPGERHTVVCGAPNVAVGLRVPLARPGALLPGGHAVATTEIRGISSSGMLCSAAEIGLGDDASGLLVLPADAALGTPVAEALGVADTVFELSITPNRGDCLSVLGIAREIVALGAARWRDPGLGAAEQSGAPSAAATVSISIADPEVCRRYIGQVIDDVRIAPSPAWLQARLRAVGLRPINNVVDITNYVMIERGQPLHAFDLERLPAPEITVRLAGKALDFTTLDSVSRALVADDVLITSGGEPVALAGIMGGENSEVVATTRRLLLEAAWFRPESVRRTAKRLGLRSEASYRFERGIDVEGVAAAAARAAALLVELAGARGREPACDAYPRPHQRKPIELRLPRLEALLGVPCERDDVAERLRRFGMDVEAGTTSATWAVVPPSYRNDVEREIDVIEEVARSLGYESIPTTLPRCELGGAGHAPTARVQRGLRQRLASCGFDEVVALSFASVEENRRFPGLVADRAPVRILNPLTEDDREMRLSLWPGLLRALSTNLAHGAQGFAGFTLSKVFWSDRDGYQESLRLAGVVCGEVAECGVGARRGAWEFADLKGVVEVVLDPFRLPEAEWQAERNEAVLHPGKSASIHVRGRRLGVVGCLHPQAADDLSLPDSVWLFELDLTTLLDYLPPPSAVEELPRFPVVGRDLALVAEVGFESGRVLRFIREWSGAGDLIESAQLTDRYAGPPLPVGMESLTFAISYRSRERTLTDAEVNETHAALIAEVRKELPVELR